MKLFWNMKSHCLRCLPVFYGLFLGWIFTLSSCKEKEEPSAFWTGSGVSNFYDDALEDARLMRIFYVVPEKVNAQTPIVMVFHGVERNAGDYRDALQSKANEKGFILVVPEYSEEEFPGTNGYILGDMFDDGEFPTLQSLKPESAWSYSTVPRLLSFVRKKTGNTGNDCHLIGHSAGAQFLHRMLLFLPQFELAKAVVSAAGWYTMPDTSVVFPYGLGLTPITENHRSVFFARNILVQVGNSDNNPNSENLRRTPEADVQGLHRLDRAKYFYHNSQQMANADAMEFKWSLHVIPDLNHNYIKALNHSADLLFP